MTHLAAERINWIFTVSPDREIEAAAFDTRVKTVGRRRPPANAEEAFRRAQILQAQAERLNPYPRPRGFVFKAKTREEYERWRRTHPNPRLW